MSAKKIAGIIISVSFEIIFVALIIILIYNGSVKAYTFGFSVFGEQAMDKEPGRDVNVSIDANLSPYELGQLLEEKGLIHDAKLFYIQMKIMASDEVKSERYTLNTSMDAEDIINTITGVDSDEDEKEE